MTLNAFQFIQYMEDTLWGYIGFPTILLMGLYLSIKSGWIQIVRFPDICRHFLSCVRKDAAGSENDPHAVSPLRAFFASVGGCLGIGNVVAITTAVQIGGPGAIIWIWVAAILGCLMKYAEVYIAMRTRRVTPEGDLKGGPMYFLRDAFQSKIPATLFCLFMCLYGVEIYQFSVVVDVGVSVLPFEKFTLAVALIVMVILAELGGTKRIGAISGMLVPIFIVAYIAMGAYIFVNNLSVFPSLIKDVFASAFTVRAAEGAFIGSTLLTTISQGIRKGCYSSDVGVGYASIIHSQSSEKVPERQASLLIFEVFMDTFMVCTMSVMVVLVTGVWKQAVPSSQLVQVALSQYFPYTEYFMPFFIFLLGYTTIITYFSAGMSTVQYLFPRWGRPVYYLYAIGAFTVFSFAETHEAIAVMACVQFGLLMLNTLGIWRLRKLLTFDMSLLRSKDKETAENSEQIISVCTKEI